MATWKRATMRPPLRVLFLTQVIADLPSDFAWKWNQYVDGAPGCFPGVIMTVPICFTDVPTIASKAQDKPADADASKSM